MFADYLDRFARQPAARVQLKLRLRRIAIQIRRREDHFFLVLTLVIGAIVGLTIVAFIVLTENLGARMYPAGPSLRYRRLVIPLVGSLVTGWLMYRFFPVARGSGIPETKVALAIYGGSDPACLLARCSAGASEVLRD